MKPAANPLTTLTCANGEGIDLLDPQPSQISFVVIAEHLAKANLYCGATAGLTYSVAEHSVRGAEAAYARTQRHDLAGYFLCHDMHKAYLGDDTTPKKRALSAIAQSFGVLAGAIEDAFSQLTDRLDAAIHAAAGLPWPPPQEIAEQIHAFDRMMLATEWRDLMRCPPPYAFSHPPLPEPIKAPMRWEGARAVFIARLDFHLPRTKLRKPAIKASTATADTA